MFELTNEQRKCFALQVVHPLWEKVEVRPSPYDKHKTYVYLDGRRIVKAVEVCQTPEIELYHEYSLDETLSEDGTMLLPKTPKGKPQLFSSANLAKRTKRGMSLSYVRNNISIFSFDADQDFYRSYYEGLEINSFDDFIGWVEDWCSATGESELRDIVEFSERERVHQKFREGDFFRYRINRHLFGYGRIIMDVTKLRKDGVEFWDIFAGKPLYVAIYHIATEDKNMTPEQLVNLKRLPSHIIMDNIFYYGECEIIGNIALRDEEKDYPIHYGFSINALDQNKVFYQHGKIFKSFPFDGAPSPRFHFHGIGWSLNVKLPILLECIDADSNDPYWEKAPIGWTEEDLRNPALSEELKTIKEFVND